jgi:iron complex outermembrane receptor protein
MPVGVAYLRGDYSYMDDHFTTNAVGQPRPQDIQDRETLNATLGWRTERWSLSLWGKNLTDDEYAGFTGATSPITGASPYFLTPPRTYGATLRYEI